MTKSCPRCGKAAKKVGKTFICDCGWSLSPSDDLSQKQIIQVLVLIACLMGGVLFHLFQWGKHSWSVFFASGKEKVKICMDLKKYDCVEGAYGKLFQKTEDLDYLEQLAELQFKRKKFAESGNSYKAYFSKGGKSYRGAYYYAHVLAKNRRIDDSIKYFDSILRSKPRVLMITVVESYLQVLVSHQRMDKARQVMAWVKKVSKHSKSSQSQIKQWERKFNI